MINSHVSSTVVNDISQCAFRNYLFLDKHFSEICISYDLGYKNLLQPIKNIHFFYIIYFFTIKKNCRLCLPFYVIWNKKLYLYKYIYT